MQNIFRRFVRQVKFFKRTTKTSGTDTKPTGAKGLVTGPSELASKMVVLVTTHHSGVSNDWTASIRGWNGNFSY